MDCIRLSDDILPCFRGGPHGVMQFHPVQPMTRDQQKRLNAMCGDLSAQVTWFLNDDTPVKLHKDDWRHVFAGKQLGLRYVRDPEDRTRLVTLNASSRDLSEGQASELIERLYAFGADMKVQWSDPEEQAALAAYESHP